MSCSDRKGDSPLRNLGNVTKQNHRNRGSPSRTLVSGPSVRPPGRCYKSTKEEEMFPPPTDLTAHSVPPAPASPSLSLSSLCPSKNISARPTRKHVRRRGSRQTTYADGE